MTRPENSLRPVLDEIERWMLARRDSIQMLTDVACLVGNTLHCNACSIYLVEPGTRQLLLCGTVGLRQDCVGKIRMSASEGLTGLVAEERRPVVVLNHASAHPRFKYFPDAGEDLYESFLGVPIVDRAALVGVLVVQTFDPANFSNADVQRLAEAGRELGPALGRLRLEAISRLTAALAEA